MFRVLAGLTLLLLLTSNSTAQTPQTGPEAPYRHETPVSSPQQKLLPLYEPDTETVQQPIDRNTALLNELLTLLNDAVITKLEARASLEAVEVDRANVRLQGVDLKDFRLGLRLNARGTEKLLDILQRQNAANGTAKSSIDQIFALLKLGLFNHLELEIGLKSLQIKELALDAERLKVEGLLLVAGAKPPDAATGRPTNDTLQLLLQLLSNNPLKRLTVHAGVEHLQARKLKLQLAGASLEGFYIQAILARR